MFSFFHGLYAVFVFNLSDELFSLLESIVCFPYTAVEF
jgi:hypothetical protein